MNKIHHRKRFFSKFRNLNEFVIFPNLIWVMFLLRYKRHEAVFHKQKIDVETQKFATMSIRIFLWKSDSYSLNIRLTICSLIIHLTFCFWILVDLAGPPASGCVSNMTMRSAKNIIMSAMSYLLQLSYLTYCATGFNGKWLFFINDSSKWVSDSGITILYSPTIIPTAPSKLT